MTPVLSKSKLQNPNTYAPRKRNQKEGATTQTVERTSSKERELQTRPWRILCKEGQRRWIREDAAAPRFGGTPLQTVLLFEPIKRSIASGRTEGV